MISDVRNVPIMNTAMFSLSLLYFGKQTGDGQNVRKLFYIFKPPPPPSGGEIARGGQN